MRCRPRSFTALLTLALAGAAALWWALTAGELSVSFDAAFAALVEAGATVAICGRDERRLAAAARELGPSAVPIVADVSTPDGASRFVADARRELGGIDILVPNAGGPPPGDFASTPLSAFEPASPGSSRPSRPRLRGTA